jgi:uncharacterized protein involved in exopolysaccharide biosynthesis
MRYCRICGKPEEGDMSLLERLGELGKALLTTDVELRHLRETLNEIRQEVRKLGDDMREVRERLARLEASREADRSQMAAELARFQVEVERAEIKLSRLLLAQSLPPVQPGTEEEGKSMEH